MPLLKSSVSMLRIDKRRLFIALAIAAAFVWARRESSERLDINRSSAPLPSPASGAPARAPISSSIGGATFSDVPGGAPGGELELRARAWIRENARLMEGSEVRIVDVEEGLVSSRIELQQYYMGLPLKPRGLLTLTYGRGGELLDSASSLMTSIELQNRRPEALGGEPLIWVLGAKGWFARVELKDGIETIVDADSGKVLHSVSQRRE